MAGLTCTHRRALIRGQLAPTSPSKATAAAQQHAGRPRHRHRGRRAQVGARKARMASQNG
eukprot:3694748-Pyramimonas_sp.AAC.1